MTADAEGEESIDPSLPAADADAILERLDAMGGIGEDVTFADLFRSRDLPCAHDSEENPYPRGPRFRSTTCHYVPARVGDSLAGALYDDLAKFSAAESPVRVKEGAWAVPYMFELRSLFSSLSYVYDLRERARDLTTMLATADGEGAFMGTPLEDTPTRALALAVQADSIYEHLGERLSVIASVARGEEVETEILGKMYNQERRRAGAMSILEQGMHDTVTTKEITSLTAASARGKAKALTLAHSLRPQPLPQSQSFLWPGGKRGGGGRGGGRGGRNSAAAAASGGAATQWNPAPATAARAGTTSPTASRQTAPTSGWQPVKGGGKGGGGAGKGGGGAGKGGGGAGKGGATADGTARGSGN